MILGQEFIYIDIMKGAVSGMERVGRLGVGVELKVG